MKSASSTTAVLIEAHRVVRWDAGGGQCFARPRPPGGDLREAVMAALEPGCRGSRVWVLNAGLYEQRLVVNPAQVAGLSPEAMAQALSFEIEPFSGVPVRESAIGFRDDGGGFAVVQARHGDVVAIDHAVRAHGGRLAGLAHPGDDPPLDESLEAWMARIASALESGTQSFVPEPARAPRWPRQWVAGAALMLGVVSLLGGWAVLNSMRRTTMMKQWTEGVTAARTVDAATRELAALKSEAQSLREVEARRAELDIRRGALAAVLQHCATGLPQDTVINTIEPDGISRLKLSGLAMDAAAVDEFGIVLSQLLRPHGWAAQPRLKQAKQPGRGGGPWEFVLELTHRETLPPAGGNTEGTD